MLRSHCITWIIIIDVSEERDACIFRIDDGSSTFPRMVGDISDPKAADSTFLRNVGNTLPDYIVPHPEECHVTFTVLPSYGRPGLNTTSPFGMATFHLGLFGFLFLALCPQHVLGQVHFHLN
jgi:hypothetical protein